MVDVRWVVFFTLLSLLASSVTAGVTYDGRSLIIHGKRELLFSGSIHYTRSTPDMWPDLIQKAKRGGLNVIQTYVFWNVHEPIQGQFNFEGQYDLVKYLKLIHEHKMYATLRLGPFIQAEWNHGGLPYWLREVPNITFRSDNEPFKFHMKNYVTMIIDKIKGEKLFASQGGPIILAQIENEYNTIQLAYRNLGNSYVQWAGNLALSFDVGVPWVMCKQIDAPGPVINTCNGRYCGDTFVGPNQPNKPSLWTENWTAQFRVFGDPPSQRAAEDIAFAVARFFSKNGSLNNYYMYHGGTNFGRTSAHFVTTRYYDEAPLDEYGLPREPKYCHLRDLHRALNLGKRALLRGTPSVEKPSEDIEFRIYEGTGSCTAFLTNNATNRPQNVTFRGNSYYLPAKSISILPDCKTVVYNTQIIVSQHNARNFTKSEVANQKLNANWEMTSEIIPNFEYLPNKARNPLELFSLTKDTTDYVYYATTISLGWRDLPMKPEVSPVLLIASLGHSLLAFVNGEYVGSGHGSHIEKSFVFRRPINLKPGVNSIVILGALVGFPDSGAYMEKRFAGPRSVEILGLNTGTIDLTNNHWGHQVGLEGERLRVYTEEGLSQMQWRKLEVQRPALSWFKSTFDAPEGDKPVAIRMNKMGKGMVWINGISIGRYWVSYLSPLGEPTQAEYHVPRYFLKPKDNLMVVFEEEEGGKPETIQIELVDRDIICSFIRDQHLPTVRAWEYKNKQLLPAYDAPKPMAGLQCPTNKVITEVQFASYGDPVGVCGAFNFGNCSAPSTKEVVERYCLGKNRCEVPYDRDLLTNMADPCPTVIKNLAIQVKCDYSK
ncbi:beta-galactosidase 13-like [Mangifera indica]|uniref:beta-galactosidase 13-like n=1 Tax=Mangifera indica TaxID=29780 RepID=UPI001CFB3B65|nr:beta-galactosidase 13-like [Mangifera indica]